MRVLLALAALLLCTVLRASPARAAVERFAVLIGSNHGEGGDSDLRYAESDAQNMYDVLKDVGGFRVENMLLLRGEGAPAITRALIAMNDRIRAARSRPDAQIVLFVYYSGHGDALALKTNRTRLELTVLEQLVRSSAAAFRVLLVDACRSGSLTRVKGGTVVPAIDVRVDQSLDGEGTVFLTSSSANEDSQESDAVRGSFFTHFFRSGLLGPADVDRDGRVTLDEAYRYARDATLRASSQTLAGLQHATFRYEMKGQAGVVLTTPGASATARVWLEFPDGRDYLVFARDEQGPIVAELGAHDRVRRVSVPAGVYFVRGRAQSYLLEGSITVAPSAPSASNARFAVLDSRLNRVEYARLARKGGTELHFVHGPFAGYSTRSPIANSDAWCHGAFVGYAMVFPSFTFAPRLGACRTTFDNRYLSATVDTLDAALRVSHSFDLPLVSLDIGFYGGPTLYSQRFHTSGIAPARTTIGAHFGIGAGLDYDLGAGLSLFTESNAEAHTFELQPTADAGRAQRSIRASIAFNQKFALSKTW